MAVLLAVDLGVKTGLALYGQDGRLLWYRSQNFGTAERLRREQRSGVQAKESATDLARRVIIWSGARRPTSLRDDAAEAILIGLWGTLEVGWLGHLPAAVRR